MVTADNIMRMVNKKWTKQQNLWHTLDYKLVLQKEGYQVCTSSYKRYPFYSTMFRTTCVTVIALYPVHTNKTDPALFSAKVDITLASTGSVHPSIGVCPRTFLSCTSAPSWIRKHATTALVFTSPRISWISTCENAWNVFCQFPHIRIKHNNNYSVSKVQDTGVISALTWLPVYIWCSLKYKKAGSPLRMISSYNFLYSSKYKK